VIASDRFQVLGSQGGLVPQLLPSGAPRREETSPHNSFYVRNDRDNGSIITFVHGVTGNNRSTWTSDRTHRFWPEMLTKDPAFKGGERFVYGS
jgi:hypothetical protein